MPGRRFDRWKAYGCEAVGLGGFLLVVGVVDALLFASQSPLDSITSSDALKRLLVGIAAGLYLVVLIYSPLGKESGAHINPSITLAFLRLRKIAAVDAGCYMGAQFVGAVVGVALFALVVRPWGGDPTVNYVVTVPITTDPLAWGWLAAFVAELLITLSMMLLVLEATNSERYRRFTGLLCGAWLALLILVESPISGTSLNPARSTGSAVVALDWGSLLLYFVAPPLGAQLAVLAYRRGNPSRPVVCAKLHHHPPGHPGTERCIMRDCGHRAAARGRAGSA